MLNNQNRIPIDKLNWKKFKFAIFTKYNPILKVQQFIPRTKLIKQRVKSLKNCYNIVSIKWAIYNANFLSNFRNIDIIIKDHDNK